MALIQRRGFDRLGYPQTYDVQLDYTDCVDDDFETLVERAKLMKYEQNRLNTFTAWPPWSSQRPKRLAEAGLYYTGVDDRVQCPFCFGVLKKWERWDVPMSEHGRHFPYCRFVQGDNVGNIPIEHETTTAEPTVSQQTSETPDLTKEENRLATFLRWPPNMTQTPEALASAGFYHIPCEEKSDRVKCAYCHGKLYGWNVGDDPWIEHARCFPKCPYVKLCVGESVIQELQKEKTISRRESESCGMTSTNFVSEKNSTPRLHDVTSRMRSEAVQAVLEMGFSEELVRKVLEKFPKDGRKLSISAEDLASAVLEMEEPEVPVELEATNQVKGTSGHNKHNICKPCASGHEKSVETAPARPAACKNVLSNSEMTKTLRKENSCLRDQYLCKVCMENQITVTFMPCGHLACCGPCSMAMSECPVCRSPITGYVRTYY